MAFCQNCAEPEIESNNDLFFMDEDEQQTDKNINIFGTDANDRNDIPVSTMDLAFPMVKSQNTTKNQDVHLWVGDSGASCHMTNSLSGMYNIKDKEFSVTIGDGQTVQATKTGKWKGYTNQKDESSNMIILNFVAYIPSIFMNLFSITQALKNGSNLSNKGQIITVQKSR